MRCRCAPLSPWRVGYACRLSAGHDGPCDFRTAEEVRWDNAKAAMMPPVRLEMVEGTVVALPPAKEGSR